MNCACESATHIFACKKNVKPGNKVAAGYSRNLVAKHMWYPNDTPGEGINRIKLNLDDISNIGNLGRIQ